MIGWARNTKPARERPDGTPRRTPPRCPRRGGGTRRHRDRRLRVGTVSPTAPTSRRPRSVDHQNDLGPNVIRSGCVRRRCGVGRRAGSGRGQAAPRGSRRAWTARRASSGSPWRWRAGCRTTPSGGGGATRTPRRRSRAARQRAPVRYQLVWATTGTRPDRGPRTKRANRTRRGGAAPSRRSPR